MKNTSDKVDTVGCTSSDNNISKRSIFLNISPYIFATTAVHEFVRFLNDGKHGKSSHQSHNDTKEYDDQMIEPFRALRAISQRRDNRTHQQEKVDDLCHFRNDRGRLFEQTSFIFTREEEVESEVEVADREPREDELDQVVDELDSEQKLLERIVTGRVDLSPVKKGMQGGKEGSVQPATAL